MWGQLFVVCSLLFAGSSAVPNCPELSRKECRREKLCAQLGQDCFFDRDVKCSEVKVRHECRRVEQCSWNRDECVELAEELKCSRLRSRDSCFAYRNKGCRFLRIDGKFKCLHKENVSCEELSSSNCRRMKKCVWQQEKKTCVPDFPERCPDCAKVVCPLIKCSKDAISVIPDGECCATCIIPPKCPKRKCLIPKCLEGEKVVQEPDECCPTCKKTCSCPEQDCSKVKCPRSLPCGKDEQEIKTNDGCCTECVKSEDCSNTSCKHSLRCEVGEEVVTEQGECCPVCKKEETCETSSPSENQCDLSKCAAVSCAIPLCDKETEVLDTLEGECCPQCFPKFPKIDCSRVRCGLPQCKEGERVVQKPGDCCLSCQKACSCAKDCSLVKCPIRQCGPNQDPVPFAGGCCNSCIDKPKCLVPCGPPPRCNEGQVLFREPGTCCPVCQDLPCIEETPVSGTSTPPHCIKPDCSTVLCAKPQCSKNEFEFTPFGECCPICKEFFPCPAIPCPVLQCEPGFMVVDDPTKCCPECLEECDCPEPGSAKCPRILKPVECNGCTYNNLCLAEAAGFEETECKLVNDAPPLGVCFGNDDCDTDAGEICYDGFDELCDVDCGKKSCPGKCVVAVETPQGFCGGKAGFPCPEGSRCVDAKGDNCSPNCGGADCGGICISCPDSGSARCPKILKPVDCDGCTYNNQCLATAAGFEEAECKLVNDPPPSDVCFGNDECNTKAGEICYTGFNGKKCDEDCGGKSCPGKCVVEVKTKNGLCGGFAGFPCPKGTSCVDAKGDECSPNCGGADCGGICIRDTTCPESGITICPKIKKPVECAGCTYSNLCLAEAAGFTEKDCESALVGVHA